MIKSLIDTGPIISLYNRKDKYHNKIVKFFNKNELKLFSTWPIITESIHLLSSNSLIQIDLLKWIQRGGLNILNIEESDIERIIEVFTKYSDIPMDFADCSIMIAAEKYKIQNIITIDSDYYVYRLRNKKQLKYLFEKDS